ncbi:hypothetical protein PZ897_03900 [Hoeflea sp. YIM 152468]|uniref:hypothetical protein n=1 Tax=Hoeflea sp. YIM 152468 TaxID=3031759 RepID=UPI0023DCAFED|nr:hypothetical protein [Hoeflea sp. YIM 152468]MDF1607315.1 hypothetical protein [Hoeflea sp. YIM 152468]
MKKILAATAVTLMFTAGAFADTNANNTRTELDAYAGGDTAVIDMMMDEQGQDRTEADFMARWTAATPEQQAKLKDACTQAQEAKLKFSDMVASHCKAAAGN